MAKSRPGPNKPETPPPPSLPYPPPLPKLR
jgi:hypothetical protein